MPWSKVKGGGTCSEDEWAVIKDDDGSTEGCHATEAEADDQIAALYASEESASVHWSVCQVEGGWEVRDRAGSTVATSKDYGDALSVISARLGKLATDDPTEEGLLEERWVDQEGIAFSEETGDGRDFRDCMWSWRDPDVSLLPLMLQSENPEWGGHAGAVLAGFIEQLSQADGAIHAQGRFYDTDEGEAARDLLLGGRRFGVSVDCSGADAEWVCEEVDDDGWCTKESIVFHTYEIAGLTLTPFPAFARASIVLEGESVTAAAPPTRPPAAWFAEPEPEMGDDRLVAQGNGRAAVPLTITAEGQVYGHAATWGQPHVGFPGQNVNPPESASRYAHFHVGEVVCADGSRVATGTLTASCDHAVTTLRAPEARDHYAHSGVAWADVRCTDGEFGVWISGALRPDVTDEQLRVLRASALSGDWRRVGGAMELIACLSVNTPGFPISREAIAASGMIFVAASKPRGRTADGEPQALVASNVVYRCRDCEERASLRIAPFTSTSTSSSFGNGSSALDRLLSEFAAIRAEMAKVERRTRHLIPEAARYAARPR